MSRPLRIGTRGSKLALAQTGLVADVLRAAGVDVELVTISTAGDRDGRPIGDIGVGVFTSALRDALAGGEIDVAVHSYRDLPTAPDPRLVLAAVPVREDPRDALVARDGLTLGELPDGSTVGPRSPPPPAPLAALRLGLVVVPTPRHVAPPPLPVTHRVPYPVVHGRPGPATVLPRRQTTAACGGRSRVGGRRGPSGHRARGLRGGGRGGRLPRRGPNSRPRRCHATPAIAASPASPLPRDIRIATVSA